MPQLTTYGSLCSVAIRHAFYRNSVPRDFVLEPSAETRDQLKNWGVQYIAESDGFKLAIPLSQIPLLQQNDSKEDPLAFYLFNHNPYFLNFTELPLNFNQIRNREILYFENRSPEGALIHTGENRTSAGIVPFDRTKIVLQLVEKKPETPPPPHHIQLVSEPGSDLTIEYLDPQQDKVLRTEKIQANKRQYLVDNQLIYEEPIREGQRQFLLDLTEWPEGKYAIRINGEVQGEPFCILKRNALTPPLGLINIYLEDIVKNWTEDTRNGPAYEVHFTSRETFWKYYFINETEGLDIKSVAVRSKGSNGLNGQSSPAFDLSPGFPKAINGRQTSQLTSTGPIRLKEQYEWKFRAEVVIEKSTSPITIKDMALPVASPERLEIEQEKLFSEIYVYI